METFNEADLNSLIDEKLNDCKKYSNLCNYVATSAGRQRAKERIREIIFNDGISDVDTAIGIVETQLIFE